MAPGKTDSAIAIPRWPLRCPGRLARWSARPATFCGGCVRPFFFVLDDSVTDDGGLLVQLSEAMAAGLSAPYVGGQLQQVGLDLVEVSRGLPL